MTDINKNFSELIRRIASQPPIKSPNLRSLATTIVPTTTPTPREPTIGEKALTIVVGSIGLETYKYLYQQTQYRRTLDLLMTSQILLNGLKGKILFADHIKIHREYSYLIAPAAKGFEGALLAIALDKRMITQIDIDNGVQIGNIYADHNGKEAKAKAFVLKPKDKGLVNKIYADWHRFRNKSLHYDQDFFVDNYNEAEKTVNEIYEIIKLAYKIFIGPPDIFNP